MADLRFGMGHRRRVRDDVLVLGHCDAGETRPDLVVEFRRPPDKLAGRAGVSPAGEVNEVQVFEGFGRRNAVERADVVVPDGDGPGRTVGSGVVDFGGDVSRDRAHFFAAARCSRLVEIRRALVYSERTSAILRTSLGNRPGTFAGESRFGMTKSVGPILPGPAASLQSAL